MDIKSSGSESFHADPSRSSSLDISLSGELLAADITMLNILSVITGITAILDENRQIVYANEEFIRTIGISSINTILGKRPGEAISCINSGRTEFGCGTSEECSVCGAVNAIIESQKTGIKSSRETRISSERNGVMRSWDLRVTSCPVSIRENHFFIFTIEDISGEKKRQSMERIFFHDILNSVGNLNGLLTILKENSEPEETGKLIELSQQVSSDLIEEIMYQRQLRSAENGELSVDPCKVCAAEVLNSAVERISGNEIARNKKISATDKSGGIEIITDRILLQRVLINVLKNAIEATDPGGIIETSVEILPEFVRFTVKNSKVMSKEVMHQVFQRSFSTKGRGRGSGTYSIRLLTVNYLNGNARFTSTEKEGTIFYIDIPRKGLG
jgi:hypothetical protein